MNEGLGDGSNVLAHNIFTWIFVMGIFELHIPFSMLEGIFGSVYGVWATFI